MCWNGYHKEIDKNVISSNTNINDDQQHITRQDDTIIMSKRQKKKKKCLQLQGMMISYGKNHI